MPKITIPVSGMHCKSCELLIEENLKKVPGVVSAKSSFRAGQTEIFYEKKKPAESALKEAIRDAGYEIGQKENLPWFSSEPVDYQDLIKSFIILGALFVGAQYLGLFKLSLNPTSENGILVALLIGLVAGVSTCMALVGGLVLSLSARHAELHPEATPKQKFRPHLYFNLGRIIGFGLLGGIIGSLGKAFSPSPNVLGGMTIIVGLVMIFLGLKLIEIFPALRQKTISLPTSIAKIFGLHKEIKEYSHQSAMLTGALTFFLPCGFTQAMQLYAISTGSFITGAIIMALFALGTAPGLLGIGGLTAYVRGKAARLFFMTAGLIVIILGWINISNGSQLLQIAPVNNNLPGVVTNQESQIVNMTQNDYGYQPNTFTVEVNRPVKWVVISTNPFSCASLLVMPKYNISKRLSKGENIIEFTPTQTGEIPFSCSMGMYRGKFIVVDKKTSSTSSADSSTIVQNTNPSSSSCGSCSICNSSTHQH